MNQINQNKFSLSIGGIGAFVECEHKDLCTRIKKHYQDFLVVDPAQFNLVIEVEGEMEEVVEEVAVQFDQDHTFLSSPGYQGEVNLIKKSGRLTLNRKHLLEGVDYFIRVVFSLLTFDQGGLMIHAAGIARHGRAYLFLGHSGSGKTTVSRLSKDCQILNDDLVILTPIETGWRVYGTPFSNPTQVKPSPHNAPLEGLYFLVKDKKVFLEPARGGIALAELISNIPVLPANPYLNLLLIERCTQILTDVEAFKLHFLKDESFWNVVEKKL